MRSTSLRRLLRASLGIAIAVAAAAVLAVVLRGGGHGTQPPTATQPVTQAASRNCTRFASPDGSDRAPGSARQPFRTPKRLVASLGPGQTGCLRSGVYVEDVTVRRGGSSGAPITLRSAPGEVATLQGRLWIAKSANWVTVADLHLDGRNADFLPSPTVDSAHDVFLHDDVTNHRMGGLHDGDGICFGLGDPSSRYGIARYTTIEDSTIHDCGTSDNHNHGIYVAGADHTTIVRNWIWDNGDRGIQLYPDAQHTLIADNIIADNGEGVIFSGDRTHASSHNLVIHNVIVGSRLRHNVESWWPGPVGTDNVVEDNCLYGGEEGNVAQPEVGFTARSNRIVEPEFTSGTQPAGIVAGTPCAAYAPSSPAATRAASLRDGGIAARGGRQASKAKTARLSAQHEEHGEGRGA